MKILRTIALGMGGLSLSWGVAMAVAARLVEAPAGLGVRSGRLAPCPASPNCVSSQADPADTRHYMEPLPLTGSLAKATDAIRGALERSSRTEIISQQGGYTHAVARSRLMGFPDDIEFMIDESAGLIHFRSAARLGYSDAGVNRARMERIIARITAALSDTTVTP